MSCWGVSALGVSLFLLGHLPGELLGRQCPGCFSLSPRTPTRWAVGASVPWVFLSFSSDTYPVSCWGVSALGVSLFLLGRRPGELLGRQCPGCFSLSPRTPTRWAVGASVPWVFLSFSSDTYPVSCWGVSALGVSLFLLGHLPGELLGRQCPGCFSLSPRTPTRWAVGASVPWVFLSFSSDAGPVSCWGVSALGVSLFLLGHLPGELLGRQCPGCFSLSPRTPARWAVGASVPWVFLSFSSDAGPVSCWGVSALGVSLFLLGHLPGELLGRQCPGCFSLSPRTPTRWAVGASVPWVFLSPRTPARWAVGASVPWVFLSFSSDTYPVSCWGVSALGVSFFLLGHLPGELLGRQCPGCFFLLGHLPGELLGRQCPGCFSLSPRTPARWAVGASVPWVFLSFSSDTYPVSCWGVSALGVSLFLLGHLPGELLGRQCPGCFSLSPRTPTRWAVGVSVPWVFLSFSSDTYPVSCWGVSALGVSLFLLGHLPGELLGRQCPGCFSLSPRTPTRWAVGASVPWVFLSFSSDTYPVSCWGVSALGVSLFLLGHLPGELLGRQCPGCFSLSPRTPARWAVGASVPWVFLCFPRTPSGELLGRQCPRCFSPSSSVVCGTTVSNLHPGLKC